jgi:hypothetical protein
MNHDTTRVEGHGATFTADASPVGRTQAEGALPLVEWDALYGGPFCHPGMPLTNDHRTRIALASFAGGDASWSLCAGNDV